jgi:UDP-2,4-diacetamido-2,4,6-trideoxy-beta-L-altropyranose hydrolase
MSDSKPQFVFRVDSSSTIGSGHFMRCLAIADAYRDIAGRSVFVCADVNAPCQQLADEKGIPIRRLSSKTGSTDDALELVAIASELAAGEVLLDGYGFDGKYRKFLRSKKLSVVVLDDSEQIPDETDLVINQNFHAQTIKKNTNDVDLLGLKYCLLGKKYFKWRNWKRKITDSGHRILICFGGGDNIDSIQKSIDAVVQHMPKFEMTVVGTGANSLVDLAESFSKTQKVSFHEYSASLDEMMAWADIGVGASGSMTWERAFMGLPSIAMSLAANQEPVGKAINELQIGVYLGSADNVDVATIGKAISDLAGDISRRAQFSQNARQIIDGFGADRVAQFISREPVRLRRASMDDKKLIFDWVNEPTVREMSFTKDLIDWDTHCKWYKKRVDTTNCLLLVAHDGDDSAVGQIRFDIDQNQADVSISVSSDFRGRGLSRAILSQGLRRIVGFRPIKRVNAFIQPGNKPSIQLFRGAGFVPMPSTSINGQPALHYILELSPAS